MKRILPLLALLLSGSWLIAMGAGGATANVSWTAPTTYTDGTTLPANDIASYTVSWVSTAPGAAVQSKTVPGGTLATSVNVPCGSANFSVTVTTTATAAVPNATSGPDGPVTFASGVSCAPNPPGALAVSAAPVSAAAAVKKP